MRVNFLEVDSGGFWPLLGSLFAETKGLLEKAVDCYVYPAGENLSLFFPRRSCWLLWSLDY